MNRRTDASLGIGAYRSLTRRILTLAASGLRRQEFLREIVSLLAGFSRCQSVEVCVEDEDHCDLVQLRAGGEPVHERRRRMSESCGLFWPEKRSDTTKRSDEDHERQDHCPRATVQTSPGGQGRESVMHIRIAERYMGLVRLKDDVGDCFTKEEIYFYDGIAELIGTALLHKRAQIALRERVKELSCLYRIAQVVAQPDARHDDVFQRIIELLPPAWLHPEIAQARIDFEDQSLRTDG